MNSEGFVEIMSEEVAKVLVAITTLTGVIVTAWLSYQSKANSKDVNDAVNHRHQDQPRLIDYVIRNDQRIDILVDMSHQQTERLVELSKKIDGVSERLDQHDGWIREQSEQNGKQ